MAFFANLEKLLRIGQKEKAMKQVAFSSIISISRCKDILLPELVSWYL